MTMWGMAYPVQTVIPRRCEQCRYDLIKGWCSACDAAQQVQARDEEKTCQYCKGGICGGPGGYYGPLGDEICPSGLSPTTFHEPVSL